jgi:ABC-type nitrate/sulfonate/bicarbonate transport system ATPase subunit
MHALGQELCARHRPAVLLVTHDVGEAMLLADRVVVLSDGVISLDECVDVASPRLRSDPRFIALRSGCGAHWASTNGPKVATAAHPRTSCAADGLQPAAEGAIHSF